MFLVKTNKKKLLKLYCNLIKNKLNFVRTFVTLPFSDGKPWKSLVNSDFELEKSGKKRKTMMYLRKTPEPQ